MNLRFFLMFACGVFGSVCSHAQQDAFTGRWQMESNAVGDTSLLNLALEVGTAEKNLLYPAELTIQYGAFTGTYHLLLLKRNIRQLGIARQKIPSREAPFTLGNWTAMLNGYFDLSRKKEFIPLLPRGLLLNNCRC